MFSTSLQDSERCMTILRSQKVITCSRRLTKLDEFSILHMIIDYPVAPIPRILYPSGLLWNPLPCDMHVCCL